MIRHSTVVTLVGKMTVAVMAAEVDDGAGLTM